MKKEAEAMKKNDPLRFAIVLLALLLAILPGMAGAEEAGAKTYTFMPEIEEIPFVGDDDSQELFAGYVRSLFYGKDRQARSSESAGSQLTGNDAILYAALKPEILAVTAGTRSSTLIEISPTVFGVEGNNWTAEELGVSAIVVNGYVSDEAVQAVYGKFATDYGLVLEALLRDCSYEMFWYDKNQAAQRTLFNITAVEENGVIRIGWTGVFTYRLPVSQAYAAGQYAVSSNAVQRARTAAANARQIINRYASASDLEKLNGYRQEVCALADYNEDVLNGLNLPYGDPWQLIWVFDGDDTTNVTCEGFTKAFQYLCEETAFTGDISCITACGAMSGSVSGPHMWNILRMDDGKSYMADIANSDDGAIGSPDHLFLTGCAGGSPETYYIYLSHNTYVYYQYDEDTLALYPRAWLEMSAEKYVEPTPDPWENLDTLTLPRDTVEIEESAFECAGMERVILPDGVKSIGSRAFAQCEKLRCVNLPDSLLTIADDAFAGCENLTVLCARGSAAETYAQEHGFACAYPEE